MNEWEKLGGVKQTVALVDVPRSFLDDLEATHRIYDRINAYIEESMSYWLGGVMPFDRQLYWHGCHRWSAKAQDDPSVEIAEARRPKPEHWDRSYPAFLAAFDDDLGQWPRWSLSEEP